jgi:Ser/Thr protein kinase RdoA (MazF antagonist)
MPVDIDRSETERLRMAQVSRVLGSEWVVRAQPEYVRAFTNFVYLLRSNLGPCFLRVTSGAHRSEIQLASELEFLRFLSSRGVAVSEPVPSRSERLIHSTEIDGRTFHASVFRAAPGMEFGELSDASRRDFFRTAGRTMGRLHAEGRAFVPSRGFQRFRWQEDRWSRFAELVPETEKEAWRLHDELEEWTAVLPRDRSLFGYIHGDFTIVNMRVAPRHITLFDFDACCEHWYAYEIATFLHYFGGQDAPRRKQAYDCFLEGYAQTGAVDERVLSQVPLFGKMRLLYSFLVFAEAWGFQGLTPEQHSYFERRRRLFGMPPAWPPPEGPSSG